MTTAPNITLRKPLPPGLTIPYVLHYAVQKLKREPLLRFGWPGEPHRAAARYHAQGIETLFRGSNDAAKTGTGSAITLATLMGMKTLCGEPLPAVELPATWWVLVQTYKQQVDASQAWILRWMGEHPHRLVNGAKGYVEHIFIATTLCRHGMEEMHKAGFRCPTCSKLVFHCSESPSGIGGKIDGVWADEPPDEDTWREMRRRGKGNRLFYKLITATPVEKKWWGWMPADFKDVERNPRGGRVEVRATMDDNRFLLPHVKAQKIADTQGDLRARARLYGDYVDITGESPFPPDKLELWRKRCRPPKLEQITLSAERRTPDGDVLVPVRCMVEIFAPFDDEETYMGVLDPATFLRLDHISGLVATDWTREGSSSRGVPDPCGFHLYARRKPRLVVRFSGYCGAYGLGSLGAIMARRYGNALLDTDLTGGHGKPTVTALTKAGYYHLNNWNPDVVHLGQGDRTLGFSMTGSNRAQMIAAIQQALLDDALLCESEAAVRSLMEVVYVMTPSGKERPEASYGAKDEDMICMGRFLHLHGTTPIPRRREVSTEEKLTKLLGLPIARQRHQPRGGRRILWTPR